MSALTVTECRKRLEEGWRSKAPKKLVKERAEGQRSGKT
jgi:hypothetical protein